MIMMINRMNIVHLLKFHAMVVTCAESSPERMHSNADVDGRP
jgi:hypothetical protein